MWALMLLLWRVREKARRYVEIFDACLQRADIDEDVDLAINL